MEVLKVENTQPGSLEDSAIVKRVISGEKELFEILLRRYNQTLYRVIRSYLKDKDEVQDAMQDTYLKAYDKLFQFQAKSSFSTWLIRIGINEALQKLRNLDKVKTVYMDSHSSEAKHIIDQIPDKQMNPEKAIIRSEANQLLEKAIDNLPEKYRLIYVLREVEELEMVEIGEALSLTETNVKVRLHRAKNLLKKSLFELTSSSAVFEFGNLRCDSVVHFVMARI